MWALLAASSQAAEQWEVMEGAPLPALASVFPLCNMGAKCVCAHLPAGSGRAQRATNVRRRKEAAVPTSGRAVAVWGVSCRSSPAQDRHDDGSEPGLGQC